MNPAWRRQSVNAPDGSQAVGRKAMYRPRHSPLSTVQQPLPPRTIIFLIWRWCWRRRPDGRIRCRNPQARRRIDNRIAFCRLRSVKSRGINTVERSFEGAIGAVILVNIVARFADALSAYAIAHIDRLIDLEQAPSAAFLRLGPATLKIFARENDTPTIKALLSGGIWIRRRYRAATSFDLFDRQTLDLIIVELFPPQTIPLTGDALLARFIRIDRPIGLAAAISAESSGGRKRPAACGGGRASGARGV